MQREKKREMGVRVSEILRKGERKRRTVKERNKDLRERRHET